MNRAQQGQRIVWLVRLLTAIGLVTVVMTTGLVGWTLTAVRRERARAAIEQGQLVETAQKLREQTLECETQLHAVPDETAIIANRRSVDAGLIEFIRTQSSQQTDAVVRLPDQFNSFVIRLEAFIQRAYDWRGNYEIVWADVSQQRTLEQARNLVIQLRATLESFEGRRRLDEAIRYKRWRAATGEDASRQAQAILIEHARQQSQGANDFKSDLAECARFVELLGSEQQLDNLADLKDNKLVPVLDRLSRTFAAFGPEQAETGATSSQTIENLKVALFGPTFGRGIQPGGLFKLRQDTLRLRSERERLNAELRTLFNDIEAANAEFAQTAQSRTAALAQQLEHGLASAWQQILIFGGGCSVLFLWLAWLITGRIGGQVGVIESAKSEAEAGRRTALGLMQDLQLSKARKDAIVQSALDGIVTIDHEGMVVEFNPAAEKIFGYSRAQVLGREFAQVIVPPLLREQHRQGLMRYLATDEAKVLGRRIEITAMRSDGSELLIELAITRLGTETPPTFTGFVRDITDQKRAEEQLARLRTEHRLILNSVGEGVHWVDANGNIKFENPAAAIMLGYEISEMIGQPSHRLMHHTRADGTAYPAEECHIYATLRDGQIRRVKDEVFWRKDGTSFPVEYTSTPVFDEGGRPAGSVVVFTDSTERKLAELKLETIHKQLLDTSRLAGMAEVATNVLHNVGNVLNSVNVASNCVADSLRNSKAGNLSKLVGLFREHEKDLGDFLSHDPRGMQVPAYLAQLAENLADEQSSALKELAHLQKNIEHIKEIVAMQQSYAQISGVKEIVDISSLVEESLRMSADALHRHGVEVVREFDPILPMNVDKHKIMQILVNLVRNAKHACIASGRADKRLTLRVANGAGQVKISAIDNGVGISPENLTRIFSHGFTTRKDGHGYGLHSGALAAAEMGGSLTVRSDGPGRGAEFTLKLPLELPGVKD